MDKLKSNFYKLRLCTFALFGILVVPLQANAAMLAVEVGFTLSLESGLNALGLDGADVLFRADFADGTTFASICCGQPQANAASHSFVISGATIGGSNGIFSDPDGVALFPNNANSDGFFSELGDTISLPGVASQVRFDAGGSIPDVSNGDLLTLTQLTVLFGSSPGISSIFSSGGSDYDVVDFEVNAFEVAPVPVPAALPLMGAGLAALGFFGWRRKRKAA